jgi:hypothetical protein
LRKKYFARKNEPGKKARNTFAETFVENLEADFGDLTLQKITFATKIGFRKIKPLAYQNIN